MIVPDPRTDEVATILEAIQAATGEDDYDLRDLADDLQALGVSKARARIVHRLASHHPPHHLTTRARRVHAFVRLRDHRPAEPPDHPEAGPPPSLQERQLLP